MQLDSSYHKTLYEIAELGIWAAGFINISEVENLTCVEFEFYRNVLKEKYEAEMENRKDLIEKAFKFGGNCTETICKTIANAFGGKS